MLLLLLSTHNFAAPRMSSYKYNQASTRRASHAIELGVSTVQYLHGEVETDWIMVVHDV